MRRKTSSPSPGNHPNNDHSSTDASERAPRRRGREEPQLVPKLIARSKHGHRGLPPPLVGVSLASLADDTLLTTFEVAALTRISTNTIEAWRRHGDRRLPWVVIAGWRVRYTVADVRQFLARSDACGRPPKRNSPPTPKADAAPPPRRARHAKAEGLRAPQEPAP